MITSYRSTPGTSLTIGYEGRATDSMSCRLVQLPDSSEYMWRFDTTWRMADNGTLVVPDSLLRPRGGATSIQLIQLSFMRTIYEPHMVWSSALGYSRRIGIVRHQETTIYLQPR